MTLTDDIEHKRTDLRRMVREMKDISSNTSTYKKLAMEAERLQIELSEMGAVRTRKNETA